MARYRSFRDIDWPLLIIALIISALGVLQIYSATHDTRWHNAWWKQVVWIFVGLGLMWVLTNIDYHTLLGQVPILYCVVAGRAAADLRGRATWCFTPAAGSPFPAPESRSRPPSSTKIVIILLVARYLSELKSDEIGWRDLLKLGGLVGIPTVLVMSQPDFGTGATYLPILAGGVLLAGIRWRYLAVVAIVCALALPAGWYFLKDYQRARLTTFVDPSADPRGRGYQVIQSKIAVGHGGMWGRGVTQGTQTQLRFLPVPHTDFIFSAFAEEHGFVGIVVALGLYFLLVDASGAERADGAGSRRNVYLYGSGDTAAVPSAGERGHGGWVHARDGNSIAAHELWRLEHVFGFYDAGAGEQRQAPAVCELSL